MNLQTFYTLLSQKLEKLVAEQLLPIGICTMVQACYEAIMADKSRNETIKITQLTIILEALYSSFAHSSKVKDELLAIRIKRWGNHFGTPTVPFLLSYKALINQAADQVQKCIKNLVKADECAAHILEVLTKGIKPANTTVDAENHVVVDLNTMKAVVAPDTKEVTGKFTKTHNPQGGFTTSPCDPISQQFIKYAVSVANAGGKVLEIGAAFGAATLDALAQGATVYCNDIEPENLAVVRKRYMQQTGASQETASGDDTKLVLVPGMFPEELFGLPKGKFAAIFICRVMHFFPGRKIEQSLQQMFDLLEENGKVFIVCETPFLKNWQRFIPEHEKRVAAGMQWPGEITNPAEYESSGFAASLPQFVHWISKEVLEKMLKPNFKIEQLTYINREGQFPAELLLDGKESVGAIGVKTEG